jgi:DNA-binding YbaB/EbfC family protein
MFKSLANFASLVKNSHNLGEKIDGITEELRSKRVVGSSGGGLVKVVANGLGQVLKVEIDDLLRENGDWEMAADLLPAATNDAIGKAKMLHVDAVQAITGGISLPPSLANSLKQLLGQADMDDAPTDKPTDEKH